MQIEKLLKTVIMGTLLMMMIGCKRDKNAVETPQTEVEITTVCASGEAIESYTLLKSGDEIINDNDAVIETYHAEDGSKYVCLVSGEAHILR